MCTPVSAKNSKRSKPFFLPFQVKLTLYITSLLIVCLTLTTLIFYMGFRKYLDKSLVERLETVTKELETITEIQVRSIVQILNSVGASYQRASDLENSLLAQQKVNPLFKTVFVLDDKGKVRLFLPYQSDIIGSDLASRSFFFVPHQQKKIYISPHAEKIFQSTPSIIISVPLDMAPRDKQSLPLHGVLGVAIPRAAFFHYIDEFAAAQNFIAFIQGPENMVYSSHHPYPDEDTERMLPTLIKGAEFNVKTSFFLDSHHQKRGLAVCREPLSNWIFGLELHASDFEYYFQNMFSVLTFCLVILFCVGTLTSQFIIRRFHLSVQQISKAVKHLSAGNFDVQVDLPVTDELGIVGQHINTLAAAQHQAQQNLENAYRQLTSHELMKRDVTIAHQIQQAMVPRDFPRTPTVEIAGIYEPAREVGGDVLDYYENQDGAISILIADASGKGIPAALVMAQTKILFRLLDSNEPDIPTIMLRANTFLYQNLQKRTFVTALFGKYYPQTRQLHYCNAGHNPAFLYSRRKGAVVELAEDESFCLGAWDKFEVVERVIHLDYGDCLLLYTDGATEATNEQSEMFEEIRLKKALATYHHLLPELVREQ